MRVTVFGAAGPTGRWVCRLALDAGHEVTAVSRRPDPAGLDPTGGLRVVLADAQTGAGVPDAVADADAVLSALGAPYSRRPITIYSVGTRTIVEAMRERSRGRRLVVVSSGLTYPPPSQGWLADRTVVPLLRNVLGRTLYADMRAMEEYLRTVSDLDWTVMRPGRLVNADRVTRYRVDRDEVAGGITTRPDLAASIVGELTRSDHAGAALAPTTIRGRR